MLPAAKNRSSIARRRSLLSPRSASIGRIPPSYRNSACKGGPTLGTRGYKRQGATGPDWCSLRPSWPLVLLLRCPAKAKFSVKEQPHVSDSKSSGLGPSADAEVDTLADTV